MKRSLITEPINIITGAQGGGKTLFAIEQADLLREHGDAKAVYQVNINEPDLRHLPALPFPLSEWHVRADRGELDDAVIIVDEFHELIPQRPFNKPVPEYVQAMAQTRKRGVRFLFLTQSDDFDHFLKGSRCNRHFHLERKAGLKRSTVYEWVNTFQSLGYEKGLIEAKKRAIVHNWWHPKKYFNWYVSAKSHHFRKRVPLRLWLVPVFVVGAIFLAVRAWSGVGNLMDNGVLSGDAEKVAASSSGQKKRGGRGVLPVQTDPSEYQAQFFPVVAHMPSSAPAFQGREIQAEPALYCVGSGEDFSAGCRCYTEQGTPYEPTLDAKTCKRIARHGVYDPYRAPLSSQASMYAAAADGKAHNGPRPPGGGGDPSSRGVGEALPHVNAVSGAAHGVGDPSLMQQGYGGMRPPPSR